MVRLKAAQMEAHSVAYLVPHSAEQMAAAKDGSWVAMSVPLSATVLASNSDRR